MYEEKIHELELMIDAYKYLEELSKKYTAKYKKFGSYVFSIDNCKYNIATPELIIKFWRYDNMHVVFHLKAGIKYTENKFNYEIYHFNHKEDKEYKCNTEDAMIAKFEAFLNADCKYVMQQDRKKTLKSINSLPD